MVVPETENDKREYTKTTYELVPEEPPPSKRGRVGSHELLQALVALRDNPGDWFRVAICGGNSGASALKSSISNGRRKVPDGKYEYRAVGAHPEDGKSTMYARYLGE